ncbi:metal ion binding [Homalodisca vitripennis]|nr:metal ion binding [Homalodisca vitripennis]
MTIELKPVVLKSGPEFLSVVVIGVELWCYDPETKQQSVHVVHLNLPSQKQNSTSKGNHCKWKQTASTTHDTELAILFVLLLEAAYASLVLPDSIVEMLIEPTIITGNTSMNVIILDCDDAEIMLHISDMADIQGLMQEESEHLPLILNPAVGMACVGCFTEDDAWYRAVVKEVLPERNAVKVYYVDYGNEEMLPIERLREIKEEWARLPMMSFPVTLWNVVIGPEYDHTSCTTMLKNCLTSPPYTMTIEARQPCLQVELFSASGELVYQPLLDVGLLTKI